MSYCRWSTDDFRCDVYTYESVYGGWRTHVAGLRHTLGDDDLPAPVEVVSGDEDSFVRWYRRHQQVMKLINTQEYVPIGLPHDGETFTDDTPGECADRLQWLRGLGYRVPQAAIDALREEAAAGSQPEAAS